MRKLRIAAYSLGLLLISATGVPAQTIAPGDAVSGTVIIDGNDFMHAQHMDQLIGSNAQSTIDGLSRMQNLHDSAMSRAMMGGGGGGGTGGGAPYVPPEQSHQIDMKTFKLDHFDFAPQSDDVIGNLAKKNARGDSAKQEQLTQLYRKLVSQYHTMLGSKAEEGRVSIAWFTLLDIAYSVNQGSAYTASKADVTDTINAFELFDSALQLQNKHLQSSAEKERAYDTLVIMSMMIGNEGDLAQKRHDAQLMGKLKLAAANITTKLFGCSPDSMSYHDCVYHIGVGSTNYLRKNYTAFLQM